MKLFKWNTEDIKPTFENFVESTFGTNIKDDAKDGQEVSTVPSVNIADENTAFEVDVALPGVSKDEIKLELDGNCLVISSEKQYEDEDINKNWTTREYGYASFQRMFQLPSNIDENKVDAVMKNGILKIRVGKDESNSNKKVRIKVKE